MAQKLDPWGHFAIEKYEKLFSQFGINPIDEKILEKLPVKHKFFRRKIIFGHRDYDKWLDALNKGEKVAILTGFMPSGHVHLGHFMLFQELKYYQDLGVSINIAIADAEAYAVRRIPRKKLFEYAREYIKYSLAAGLDPKKTRYYFQTNNSTAYYRLIQMFSRKITMAEMEAIYGELEPAKVMAALTQASDILHLQLPEYGGYKYVLVPVGVDQDPHIRLTRDLADRFENELGLRRPSSTYHKFIRGLDGNKMSSSKPDYAIFLSDDKDTVYKKVMNALTGGRATAEEQKRLGGEPEKCTVYELYMYYLTEDDDELYDIYSRCRGGKLLCGECKRKAARKLIEILEKVNEKAREYEGIIDDIVEFPKF
ncbi:tryptophan--tRNA ligase [Desulfurococcaceae archaeon MEX13E-LK6-19]|nr:tryptophan--tRNA ligase [Desulfurococcaceae archaeon MEX13E-LK6-19]